VQKKYLEPKNLGSLKGKSARTTPSRVQINSLDNIPTELLDSHNNVTLAIDIMYLNKTIPFMIMTSRAIHFGTAEMRKNKKTTIMTSLKHIIDTYNARSFRVKHVLVDGQFEWIRKNLEHEGIILNKTAHDKQIPEVERYIHTIKERTQATVASTIFEISTLTNCQNYI
jgi:hypothetical protein